MWLYVEICGNMGKICQNVQKHAKTCKQTSHPPKALIRAKYYKVLQTIAKCVKMCQKIDTTTQQV